MHNPYIMNSPTGKKLLAWLREGDFAHPGEAAAVEYVLQGYPGTVNRQQMTLLDAGCGRGGTLGHLAGLGVKNLFGFDQDGDSIAYAKQRYPAVHFRQGKFENCSQLFDEHSFDVLIVMCVLYLVHAQQRTDWLTQLRALAHNNSYLAVFDYQRGNRDLVGERDGWIPLDPPIFAQEAADAGWKVVSHQDMTAEFTTWYDTLTSTIRRNANKIVVDYGHEWLETLKSTYGNQLLALRRGALGGGVWWLTPTDN